MKDFDGRLVLVLPRIGLSFCSSVSTSAAHQLHSAVGFSFPPFRLCQLLFLKKERHYFAVLDLGTFLICEDIYSLSIFYFYSFAPSRLWTNHSLEMSASTSLQNIHGLFWSIHNRVLDSHLSFVWIIFFRGFSQHLNSISCQPLSSCSLLHCGLTIIPPQH